MGFIRDAARKVFKRDRPATELFDYSNLAMQQAENRAAMPWLFPNENPLEQRVREALNRYDSSGKKLEIPRR